MVSIILDPEMEARLSQLALKTGRSVPFFAREAIEQHVEDLEDYFLGLDALQNPGRIFTPDEAKRELGL